jgi:hypothetical protein
LLRWFRRGVDRTARRLRLVAWAAVGALLAQSLPLFAPAHAGEDRASSALAALAGLPGISASAVVLCLDATQPLSDGSTARHMHGVDCPLCQAFGHALTCEPAPSAGVLIALGEGRRFPPSNDFTAQCRTPNLAGSPRGPPLEG